MKNQENESIFFLKKTILYMKIGLPLLVLGVMQCFASESYAQNTTLNISVVNETLENVLNQIEKQTDFLFFYNDEVDKNAKVSINKTNSDIKEILNAIVSDKGLTYAIRDRHIIFVRNPEVSSQQITISGSVADDFGEPMPGVNVTVKGTTSGVVTDVNGKYSINVSGKDAVLMFSFIGYNTQEITVGDRRIIDITLTEDTQELEEVVVIGYGTVRKKDLTGSVSSVGATQLKDIPVISASQAIVGKMPGVQVTQSEGSPDADIKIRIRGGGSLTQDNSPLYIVDGFPVNNINDIAPTDIQSIDVLKDASSTAIYGARGANGVIIVTTKSGHEGKAKVSYNTYYGIKKITGYYDVFDPYEYVWWQWEAQHLTGVSEYERYFGNFQDIDLYKQMTATNWQKEILGKTGTTFSNNLSVSGGTKAVKYNISLTRNDDKEIMLGSGFNRTNLTAKTIFQINDRLSLDMSVRLSDYRLKGAGTSSNGRFGHIVQFRPTNGLADFSDVDNPEDVEISTTFILDPLKQTNDDYRRNGRLTFNYDGALNIKLLENLSYRFELGYQYNMDATKRFYGLNTSNAIAASELPLASNEKKDGQRYRVANILTYTKRDFLPGHNMTVMAGQDLDYYKTEEILSSVRYLPEYIDAVSALAMMHLGTPDPITPSDNPEAVTTSFFGRLMYDFKGKYLLQATFRADGSSKFAKGNQWGYFPSVSAAWRISDEAFMESTKGWLSNLKIRPSFGVAGNNRIGDNLWKKTFEVSPLDVLYFGEDGKKTPSMIPSKYLSNPRLKWETTVSRNIGLDFGLFKDRISGSIEFYKNTTRDLLISATIPANSGYTSQYQNIGQTSNKGIELMLNAAIVQTKDFHLSASFNIAFNKNHIDKLGEAKRFEQSSDWTTTDGASGEYLIEEGGQIGTMYGYVTDGMYSIDDFEAFDLAAKTFTLKPNVANNFGLLSSRVSGPGVMKFVNQNPDEDMVVDAANDRVVIGNANPKHTGGFGLNAQFKGFDFSAFFNWSYGNDIYNANKMDFSSLRSGRMYKSLLDIMNSDNRFSYYDKSTGNLVNDPNQLREMNKNATIWSPCNSAVPFHSWAVEDGSFLRLNNLTIGYSLPKSLLSKIKIEQLRIYVTGYNLWIWTNYSGYDPEVDSRRATPLTPGVDYCAYPRSRSYNVGLNLTF